MAIELIAKVAPKNDGFTGMVDADQVLGGGASGTLPLACLLDASITYAKLQDVSADSRVLGRAESAGAGAATELTPTQLRAIVDASSTLWNAAWIAGALVVSAGAGTGKVLYYDASSHLVYGDLTNLAGVLTLLQGGTGATTASGARTNLGLGTMATQAANAVAITGGAISGITDLAIADGGTGSSTAAAARTALGIDARLKRSHAFTRLAPKSDDDWRIAHVPIASTISRVYAITDTGTVTLQIEWRPESDPFSAGTEVLTSSLVADDTGEATTTFDDATIPAGSVLCYVASAVATAPAVLDIYVELTPD